MPPELQLLIEGLALRRPLSTIATVHRRAAEVAREPEWPVPGHLSELAALAWKICHAEYRSRSVMTRSGGRTRHRSARCGYARPLPSFYGRHLSALRPITASAFSGDR
jgi:hypothetical protein